MKRKRIAINNGKNLKYIYNKEDIPEGWAFGGLPTTKDNTWYNNGVIELSFKKDAIIPEGFTEGRLKFTEEHINNLSNVHIGEINITDGVNERHIKSGELIPDGWYVGKSDITKAKMSEACTGRINITNGVEMKHSRPDQPMPDGWYRGNIDVSKETVQKIFLTRKNNKSLNTSKPEEDLYKLLCEQYGKNNIKRQYNIDSRYPFACDFYVASEDLFIELNRHWSHGKHPFDENNLEDIKLLNKWKNKSGTYINSKGKEKNNQYHNAIITWTERDPLKLKTAIQNNLNYITIY